MHKKKRRRSRWSTGYIAKKKPSSSPHVSKDDASDEDEDDGDDEDEAGKEGAAEKPNGGIKEGLMDVEPGSAADQERSSEPNGQEEETEKEPGAEEQQIRHDEDGPEKDGEAVQHQSEQSEPFTGGDADEGVSVRTKRDDCVEGEGDAQNAITANMSTTDQSETQVERSHSADHQNSKRVTGDEAELDKPAEPMVVDATETPTTDAVAAARSETDTSAGWLFFVMLQTTEQSEKYGMHLYSALSQPILGRAIFCKLFQLQVF